MKIHIKAALLSALAFPGLGQLYKGDRVKGMILFTCVNILLLMAFYQVMRHLMPLVLSAQSGNTSDTARILMQRLFTDSPAFRLILAALGGLWFYSWVDAAAGKKGRE